MAAVLLVEGDATTRDWWLDVAGVEPLESDSFFEIGILSLDWLPPTFLAPPTPPPPPPPLPPPPLSGSALGLLRFLATPFPTVPEGRGATPFLPPAAGRVRIRSSSPSSSILGVFNFSA